jgi:hypothetical protein
VFNSILKRKRLSFRFDLWVLDRLRANRLIIKLRDRLPRRYIGDVGPSHLRPEALACYDLLPPEEMANKSGDPYAPFK